VDASGWDEAGTGGDGGDGGSWVSDDVRGKPGLSPEAG
jgi:hypothetical protein